MAPERYFIDISHPGLGKFQRIQDTDKDVCKQKAIAKAAEWERMWQRRQEQQRKAQERANKKKTVEQNKKLAAERTEEAKEALSNIRTTLEQSLTIDHAIDWNSLKDFSKFSKPRPSPPTLGVFPPEPQPNDAEFQPRLGVLAKFSSKKRMAKLEEAEKRFKAAHEAWEKKKAQINSQNEELKKEHTIKVKEWEREKAEFLAQQEEKNRQVDQQKQAYESLDPDAIESYCDLVLSNSQYPDYFPKDWEMSYNPENKILIIDYILPDLDSLPRIKEVKYVQSKNEFKESLLSDKFREQMFDDLLYQITLRTVHELFEADSADALAAVVFNGLVNHIDKATGQKENVCVLSIQIQKDEFNNINLAQVNPKSCFKRLKGVGSSKLHTITPVRPVLKLNKEDRRFVSAYSVTGEIDDSTNVAAMDWKDFENLIRELFEKEFSLGGEVKITQASRDGGVDAVAFDPDPIKGGKVVIQAKRYTNTVGVSAVRDLYGTVMNEGAMKGILITTADYGPDAYEFAKDKPLTLLNGGELLYLLEKHGHKAKIDLKKAKLLLAEQE
jgi:restriction system protein